MAGNTSKRGFASMSKEKQREIAAMGGRVSGGNFAKNRKRASAVGRIGGQNSHRSRAAAAA